MNDVWNFYVNEADKVEYTIALVKSGHSKAMAAGLRAFMHLYATDSVVRDKTNAIIDDYIIYKGNDKISKM